VGRRSNARRAAERALGTISRRRSFSTANEAVVFLNSCSFDGEALAPKKITVEVARARYVEHKIADGRSEKSYRTLPLFSDVFGTMPIQKVSAARVE
jgi:hypothetical protein